MKVYSWKTLLVTVLAGGETDIPGAVREISSHCPIWSAFLFSDSRHTGPSASGPDMDWHVFYLCGAGLSVLADQKSRKGNG